MIHQNKEWESTVGAVALGTVVSSVLSLALAAMAAWLIQERILGENTVSFAAPIFVALSSFLGTIAATAGRGEKVPVICAITAAAIYLVLLVGGAVIFEGETEGLLTGAILVTLGCGLAAITRILLKNSGGKRRYRYHFR